MEREEGVRRVAYAAALLFLLLFAVTYWILHSLERLKGAARAVLFIAVALLLAETAVAARFLARGVRRQLAVLKRGGAP